MTTRLGRKRSLLKGSLPNRIMYHVIIISLIQFLVTFAQGQGPGTLNDQGLGESYHFYVDENVPIGKRVGKISVEPGTTVQVSSLASSPDHVYFKLDSHTGVLTTAKPLNRENLITPTRAINIVILTVPPSLPIEMKITVKDINDNNPKFPKSSYAVSFKEESDAKNKQTIPKAVDSDEGKNSLITNYSIVSGNEEAKFALIQEPPFPATPRILYLQNIVKLNREETEFYQLNISATDHGNPALKGYLTVNITVADINDNYPTFHMSVYEANVNETAPPGTTVIQVEASDLDRGRNRDITYSMENNRDADQFEIHPYTGVVTTTKKLKCQQNKEKSCFITLLATDNGPEHLTGRAYLNIHIIDQNDHAPVIKFQHLPESGKDYSTVNENAKNGTFVTIITVNDLDDGLNGKVSLAIIDGNQLGHFKLNTLHSVSVLEVVDNLDREKVHVYNLTLRAVDMGTPPLSSTAHLVIYVNDINDHPPQFDQAKYFAVLSERTPVGSFVTAVKAKDSDFGMNSQITYKIVNGNELDWFHINSRTGLVTTVAGLDYEMSPVIILNISAQDGGFQPYREYTTLNVTLHDINDMPPTFKKKVYDVNMDEGLSPGSKIIQLQAEDNDLGLNGSLRYKLHSDADEIYPNCFHLNTTSGLLTTAKQLDREENEVYTIKVLAYDIGISPLTSTATVSLTLNDINDNRPVFYPSKYYPKIYANHEENKTILRVTATDRDSDKYGKVTYQLTGGDVANFRIDPESGLVSVVGRLDPSVQAHYRLTISGQDGGGKTTQNTATAMITVLTTNDLLPYFLGLPYSFSVTEDKDTDMSIGRVIGHVRVQIKDPTANITLSIIDGDPNGDFSIDPYRGNIRIAKKIDRETKSSYTLRILASSNGRYAEADARIKVLDRNDNRPTFDTGIVDINLMENWAIGKEVYQASAVDLDDGINARVTYSLRVNTSHPFMITHSGMIYLSQPLDKFPKKLYELTVIAVDSGTPQLSSSQTVRLHIQDVNDHTPVFASIKNSISLKESRPINDRFFLLSATDADEGRNKEISYRIIRGSEDGKFSIFPDGNLYIASELDRETKDFYHLTIVAEDQGIPSRSSSANISIQILDANDNAPVFSNQSYTMYIKENEAPGKYIGTVHATDVDIGRNSELFYYLDGEEDNFAIDSRNGQITSRKSFDREELIKTGNDYYTFEVLVKDNGIVPLQSQTKVKVIVKDDNDNAPQFTKPLYKAAISENAAVNTSVTKVSATDADTNENQFVTYTIVGGNIGDMFSINSATGQIILMSTLDREQIDHYKLKILAYDAGKDVQLNSSAEVLIRVLDSNDNSPAFLSPPMSIELMETVIPGSLISQFHASDEDLGNNALLTFSIVDGNINDTFHVDGKSGKIYLMQKLDYEVQKVYHLNISVSDYGVPHLVAYQRFIVYVHDDNDNSPTFPEEPVTFTINEGTPISTVIGTVQAEDPDTGINGEVRYRIASQSPPGIHFRIVNSGDILVNKEVDREETRYFSLIVVATDNANPTSAQRSSEKTVKIVIRDVNDNAPKIVSPDTFVIPANSVVGTEVGRVEAIDLDSGENGDISYRLLSGDIDSFQMSSSSGILKLRASLPAEKPILTLNIRVSDAGFADRYGRKATTTKVTVIASTDFSRGPRFTKAVYSKSLLEDVRIGTEVLKVQAQPENRGAILEYYITRVSTNRKENPNGALMTMYFSLDKDSGQLTTNDSLDRDLGFTIIRIEICAVERIDSTRVAVGKTQAKVELLDINDSPPHFSQNVYALDIPENHPTDRTVLTIPVNDPDTTGSVQLSIRSGNNRTFTISDSGILSLRRYLDREVVPRYTLQLEAFDGLHTATAMVQINILDMNDNVPIFNKTIYTFDLPEDLPVNSTIGSILAQDTDKGVNGTVSYHLLSDWGKNVFSLDSRTGTFKLKSPLDFEQVQLYTLLVSAMDQGPLPRSSTVTVYMNVKDVNDNGPIFSPSTYTTAVSENVTVGTSVLTVFASDADTGPNSDLMYGITGGNKMGHFKINEKTGAIFTNHSLDREKQPFYTLTVTATDTVIPAWRRHSAITQIMVIVNDVNDCAPNFTTPSEIWVDENAPIGAIVYNITATDKDDIGPNQDVTYSILSDFEPFSISPNNGSLKMLSVLDREQQNTYQLTIRAQDKGMPPKSSIMQITVHVRDQNDNNPVFHPKQYQANISESTSVGTILLQVTATDADIGVNGMIRYFIIEGDDNQDLSMDQSSGILRVQKNLDYERKKSYHVIVQCEDGGAKPRYDTAAVYISVVDVNDNAPVFVDSPYLAYVQENMEKFPVHVLQLSARDDDSYSFSRISYAIRDGNRKIFKINSTTGEIYAKQKLDREKVNNYRLTVIATDSGSPPLTGTGTVNIEVQDVNDNTPTFLQTQYTGYIEENQPVNSPVLTVKAEDKDERINALIRYSLLGDLENKFTVDPAHGIILTTAILDREKKDRYKFEVVAQDSGYTSRRTTVPVIIIVRDRNDNKPQFDQKSYNKTIYSPTRKGQFVFGLTAIDSDIGPNGKLIYSLSGPDKSRFIINSTTGVVKANQNLYRMTGSQFTVYVTASDQNQNPFSSQVTVTINMVQKDTNNIPVFEPMTEFVLNENSKLNMTVTTVVAHSPKGSRVRYYIAGGNVHNAFRIDDYRGIISIANPLDFEDTQDYALWIEAQDISSDPLSAYRKLNIIIVDINDNAPHFQKILYNASIYETNTVGSSVIRVLAKDADSGNNGKITYHITDGNTKDAFEIDRRGLIKTKNKIDRESIDYYHLIVEAVDQGGSNQQTGTTTVDIHIMDVDDNAPRFTRLFTASIPENAEVGSFVLQLSTKDPDIGKNAEVTYELLNNPSNKFSLDPVSGNITVNEPLDLETQQYYRLPVAAKASSYNTRTDVTIEVTDVNDNAPVFSKPVYTFEVSELQVLPVQVGKVDATDHDKTSPSNQLYYSLKMPSKLFNITDKTGVIYTIQQLHYDNTSLYNHHELVVQAVDLGVPSRSSEALVTVNVIDANDNPPRFEKRFYFSAVPYNVTIGDKILQVVARDEKDYGINAKVEYVVVAGNGTYYFHINKSNGTIHVSASLSQSMDKEFELRVQAMDKGQPPQSSDIATVHLKITDINKYAPGFRRIVFEKEISEGLPVGSIFDTVQAEDHDYGPNSEISYYITGGDPHNMFAIHEKHGNLSVNKPLDYEKTTIHRINITARDHGLFYRETSIIFTIFLTDVNDNPPIFDKKEFNVYVPENSPIGTSVFKLNATDTDSGSYGYIEYRIVGDDLARTMFTLDTRTLTVNSSANLDFELQQTYSLHILAKNPGTNLQNTAVVNVHLTSVNEFYPVFLQKEYNFSISESVKKGTTVGSVLATDLDAGVDGVVYYFLMGSSNLRGFKINALTGNITVSGKPDYESHPRLTLDVMAKNWGSVKGNDTDQCRVHITVTDANDPPVFTKAVYNESISEGVSSGTPVIQVAAHDNDLRRKDHQFTYSILAGNIGNAFQVDSVSGQIYTRSKLDREKVAVYNLTVGAIDKGSLPQTGVATVRLYINDINDCSPAFTSKPLVAYVTENLSPGFSVISLSEYTTDCDLPPNQGPYHFYPTPGPFSNYVQIDTNGLVTTKVLLDREEVVKFPVAVTVVDNGVPSMTSSLTFSIIVRDINDKPSKPRTVTIFLYLFEGKVPSEYIANVQPLDEDASGDYSCKILQSSAGADVFSIPHTCHLQILHLPSSSIQHLLISGQDGIHKDVNYNATIYISSLTNETLSNSVTLKLFDIKERVFVGKKYEKFIDYLETESGVMWKIKVFGLKQVEKNLLVFLMALDRNNEIVPKEILVQKLLKIKNNLQSLLKINNLVPDFSSCILNPCQNGGTCIRQLTINGKWQIVDTDSTIMSSPNITDYICKCSVGYGSTNCDIQEMRCGQVYCHNGGTCTAKPNGDSFCMCLDGWTGPSCTEDLNECDRNPCQQGTCHNTPGSFTCTCKKGFSGRYCETGIDHCKPNSCQGGSTCVSDLDGFTCQCPYDKWGKFCSKMTYSFGELSFLEFPTIAENVNNITVYLATKMTNALLLYNPAQLAIGRPAENFVALEIVEGMIHFSILTQKTPILQLNVPYKVTDSSWYKVQVLRIHRDVRISVNKCFSSGECSICMDNNKTCSSEGQLQYESLRLYGGHLYLGGIPNIDVIKVNQVSSHDFIGCMRSFIVNGVDMIRLQPLASRTVSQKCVRNDEKGPCSSNPCENGGTCQDKWSTFHCICPDKFMGAQCEKEWKPFSFAGGAHLEFIRRETYHRNNVLQEKSVSRQKRSLHSGQNYVSLRFRTQKDSGLLWYASSKNKFSMLAIKGQQPMFVAGQKSGRKESIITLPLNVSNGFWYTLGVLFEDNSVTLEGDNSKRQESMSKPLFLSAPEVEVLFLANTKFSLSIDGENIPGFDGCLENFELDGKKLPFGGSTDRFDVKIVGNVSSACPSVCVTSPCSSDMICEELANGYRCVPSSALTSGSKLVIMIVVPLLVIIIVLVIVCILIWRQKNKRGKKKSVLGSLCKQTRNNGTLKNGSQGVVGPNYSEAEYEDCNVLPDEIIIRNHILGELAQKAHESSCMPKPDIIESESRSVIPLEMEDGTVIIENGDHSQGNHMNEDVPEHYDLENASSIAPSDIDIVTHYKGFRDGKVNKYKPGPNVPGHRQRNSPYLMNQDHCSSPWSSNSPAANMLNYNGPLSVPARSSPMHLSNLARSSPAPPGPQAGPMNLATRQSPSLMVQNSNTHWSQHSASAENCMGKPGKSKQKAPKPQPAPRGGAAANLKGLTVDEVNRLNARPVSTNPESMLEAVTSSEDNPHLRGRLNKPNTCSILDAQDTSSNESANDSFTCSEFEYDNERARNDFEPGAMIYSKLTEVENENDEEDSPVDNRTFDYDGLDSAGESYSTLVSSDEDKSKNRGTVGSFDLDYLLTWGPNFEKLVGVFKDIALLPDSEYSPKTQEEDVTNVGAKSDEEYV